MELKSANIEDIEVAVKIINEAKAHLKEQGINQWQNGYPNYNVIKNDIIENKGYFIVNKDEILGYLCVDFDGEPAYDTLKGAWNSDEKYVVVHRLAFSQKARGKGAVHEVFDLVCKLSLDKNIDYFRVDTDADNAKMQHILKKIGFKFCGTIWFDNSEKQAFDKII